MQAKKTHEIQGDPAFWSSVDRLASMLGVESAATGYAATPSQAHAAFVEVKTRATPEQALALLAHPSPVVRLYLARHIVREAPERLAALEPLLDDDAQVSVMEGCMRGVAPVAEWVVRELCEAPTHPQTLPLLRAAARRPALGPGRFEALRRLGALAPAEAAGLARGIALDPAQPGEAVAQALEVFWPLAPSDGERLALARSLLERADGAARGALPRLLSGVRAEGALALLSSLRRDPHGGVSSSADLYWATHPEADPGEVEALIRAKLAGGDRSYLAALVNSEDPAWHALLVDFVRSNREVTVILDERAPSAVFSRAALELASFDAPGVYWGETPRSQALRYLVRCGDPGALEACRRAYEDTQQQSVWQAAAEGVVALESDGSEASLLALLGSPLLLVRVVAAGKLGEVGAGPSLAALSGRLAALADPPHFKERAAVEAALARLRERGVEAPPEGEQGTGVGAALRGLLRRLLG